MGGAWDAGCERGGYVRVVWDLGYCVRACVLLRLDSCTCTAGPSANQISSLFFFLSGELCVCFGFIYVH